MTIDYVTKALMPILSTDKKILAAYILGSVYKGSARPNSDVDLALLIDPSIKMSVFEKLELSTSLSLKIDKRVDIGLLTYENLIYASEAIFNGCAIYKQDEYKADLIISSLIGQYLNFNYERKEILDAYRA